MVHPRRIWEAARGEPAAFWLLGLYVVVEYLRPHIVYPAINVLPWGQVTIAACLIATLFMGVGGRRASGMDAWVVAFFGWALVSAGAALDPSVAWNDWSLLASWVVLYFLVTTVVTTPRRLVLFWWLFLLVNLKMSQHGARAFIMRGGSFADWGATGSPGWFQNSGEFAMQMAGFLGISWCFLTALRAPAGKWKRVGILLLFPGTAFLSVLASSSRGGQLALLGVVAVLLVIMKVRIRNLALVAAVVMGGWFLLPAEQKARFDTMGDDDTSQSRITYWEDAWDITKEYPVTGIGFRNWAGYYARMTNNPRVEVIHNTPLEASTELGFPGLFFFLGGVVTSFYLNARTRAAARFSGPRWGPVLRGMATGLDVGMVGFLIAAQFMSVLFYPIFWMHFAMTAALAGVARSARPAAAPRHRRTPSPAARVTA